MKFNVNANCPCGSGNKYKKCCGIYHQGAAPENALVLMKSRYSAYAVGNVAYIIQTTHPEHVDSQKDTELRTKEIATFSQNTEFQGLEILNFEEGEPLSYVTFRVYLKQDKEFSFTERSVFKRHLGRWSYLSGELS